METEQQKGEIKDEKSSLNESQSHLNEPNLFSERFGEILIICPH